MKKVLSILTALALVLSISACAKTEEPVLKDALNSLTESDYHFRAYKYLEDKDYLVEDVVSVKDLTNTLISIYHMPEDNEEVINGLKEEFNNFALKLVEMCNDDEIKIVKPFDMISDEYEFTLVNDEYKIFFINNNRIVTVDKDGNNEYVVYEKGGYYDAMLNAYDAINKVVRDYAGY